MGRLHLTEGDLVADRQYDIFCHQTNCFATMGGGIAKQIKKAYPVVAEKDAIYAKSCEYDKNRMLGSILPVKTPDGRICVNMYAQYNYGHTGIHTDYKAFQQCLDKLLKGCNKLLRHMEFDHIIGIPDHIGCGLAGGDWNIIFPMIRDFAHKCPYDVYIVKYAPSDQPERELDLDENIKRAKRVAGLEQKFSGALRREPEEDEPEFC